MRQNVEETPAADRHDRNDDAGAPTGDAAADEMIKSLADRSAGRTRMTEKPEPTDKPADPAARGITVTWDDLSTRKVEARLKEQDALTRTREYAQMEESSVLSNKAPKRSWVLAIWHNSIVSMAVFGVIGGLFAFACGASLQYRPNQYELAKTLQSGRERILRVRDEGGMTPEKAQQAIELYDSHAKSNPYFAVLIDQTLRPSQREDQIAKLVARDKAKEFIANVLAYGVSGVMIALLLSIAAPVTERNWAGAVVSGSVGAALGLVGGIVVSLFVDKVYAGMGGDSAAAGDIHNYKQMVARGVTWGMLGVFLALGPGVVMRNPKKLLIGLVGGLIGGMIGGFLYDPVIYWSDNDHLSTLVAMVAIGLFTGLATGIIENVAKTGWLKVTAGLIAGKQFILYRNPTFVGSGPDCQIYLFRDPQVGRRHAAIHIVPGGFELENLPLGGATVVNGKPVERARLKSGDRIQIGATALMFQERSPGR